MVKDLVAGEFPFTAWAFRCTSRQTASPSDAAFSENMRQIAALGLPVHITEMDVRLAVDNSGLASERDLQNASSHLRAHSRSLSSELKVHGHSNLGIHRSVLVGSRSLPRASGQPFRLIGVIGQNSQSKQC
jgi:hypothetical protein